MVTQQRARPPGLYDVAKLAGVSHQTVSRVINSHPSVREETRRRVQEAIDELGYRRNVAARTLVTRRSNTIGVITSVSPFWGPSSTLIGVERAARDAGFYLTVAGLRSIEPAGVKEVLGHFIDQGVEGIVVIAPEAALAHMAEPFITDLPVVMVAAGAEPAPGVQITAPGSVILPARSRGSTPRRGCGDGGWNSRPPASPPARSSPVTGPPRAVAGSAGNGWKARACHRRSLSPTT
jgi:hypothetical protein